MTICRHGLYHGVCERCSPQPEERGQTVHASEERIQAESNWALKELAEYQARAFKPFDGFTEYDRGMLARMKIGL